MLDSRAFVDVLKARGYSFFSGVPCSFLTPLINEIAAGKSGNYVGATSEGEAIAIAAGAWLAGSSAVVLSQNSGLVPNKCARRSAVSPVTARWPFRISRESWRRRGAAGQNRLRHTDICRRRSA